MTATAGLAAAKPRVTQPVLTENVAKLTNSAGVEFTFTSPNATKYVCTLDAKHGPCTSPKQYAGLTEGTHNFSVYGTRNGARRSAPASFRWTIDLTPPPAVTFVGVPTTPVATSPDITFSSTEATDTFSCRIDLGAAFACDAGTPGSTKTTAVLGNGAHLLTVTPTDAAGNVGPSATAGWQIDTVGPKVVISDPPGDPNPASSVTVHLTVVGAKSPNGVTCTLGDGSPHPVSIDCSSISNGANQPLTLTGLADGTTYTLQVTATDDAGNTGSDTATWTRNSAAAAPPVLSGPDAYTRSTNPQITWDASSGDTFSCTVDGSSPATCPEPFSPATVKATIGTDGVHTVTVADANTGSSASTWTWTLDTVDPGLTVTGGPGPRTNAAVATFAISADAGSGAVAPISSVVCTLTVNGVAQAPEACPATGEFAMAGDGSYALAIVATDAAGNATTVNRSWVLDRVAPTASVTHLTSLTGPINVVYDEVVTSLVPASAALSLTDTAGEVPTTIACRTSTGSAVACASGNFRTVALTPKHALVPGEHYTVTVVKGSVHDLAGNNAGRLTRDFRAHRTLEENSIAFVPAWQRATSKSAFGGSFVREHAAGAQAAYRFRGRSITWMTVTGPTQGKALVRVDGHKKPIVNNYAASTHYRVARTFGKLGAGVHRLTITVLGKKGARAGRGTFVSVDAFKVGTTVRKTPAITMTWKRIANSQFLGGHAAVGELAGEAYTLSFRGTSVTWRTLTSRTQGIAKVYLDGVLKATVDNYSSSAAYRVARTWSKLADRVHTLRIVVTGKHHAGARGSRVTVDRVTIG
ncbi:MAG TPA: Ig-like domain-containing protein [Mycobacteriales bacterium]|nr:Ig-like domain-containing protein [Mycobacteriales bacterium]